MSESATAAPLTSSSSTSASTTLTATDSDSSGGGESKGESSTGTTAGETAEPTMTGTSTTTAAESESDAGGESDSDSDTDTTGEACGGMMGGFDFSYLWVANTDQGSISKVNTFTNVEEARYYSDPIQAGSADPSRTSVNIDGHYVVVSNRGAGTVTKVAASEDDCVDTNMNGSIETSPDKDTLLPYADEECVLWTAKVNTPFSVGAGPRATAWAPGTSTR